MTCCLVEKECNQILHRYRSPWINWWRTCTARIHTLSGASFPMRRRSPEWSTLLWWWTSSSVTVYWRESVSAAKDSPAESCMLNSNRGKTNKDLDIGIHFVLPAGAIVWIAKRCNIMQILRTEKIQSYISVLPYVIYYGWLKFRWVPIFVVFLEGPIHELQYQRNSEFLMNYEQNTVTTNFEPHDVSFLFNPRKLIPTKIKPSTV